MAGKRVKPPKPKNLADLITSKFRVRDLSKRDLQELVMQILLETGDDQDGSAVRTTQKLKAVELLHKFEQSEKTAQPAVSPQEEQALKILLARQARMDENHRKREQEVQEEQEVEL